MFNSYMYLGVLGVLLGGLSFVSNSKHLLSVLLSLEFMALNLFFIMGLMMGFYIEEDYMLLFFLSMIVCEGALGLGVMVSMVRCWGSDYFSSFNLLQC